MFVKCIIVASFFCDYICNTPDFCRVYFDLFHIHNSTFFILHFFQIFAQILNSRRDKSVFLPPFSEGNSPTLNQL